MTRDHVYFFINGNAHVVKGSETFLPLSSYLRYCAQQPGTKVVCAEGDCGACSVLICYPNFSKKFKVVNSCIMPVYLLDGASVVTVEGLKVKHELAEVQQKMVDCHGSQCGFCTPGFVVALQSMCDNSSKITSEKIKNYTTGNLCRCTGYQPIIDAGLSIDLKKVIPSEKRYLTSEMIKKLKTVMSSSLVLKTENQIVFAPNKVSDVSKILLKYPQIRIISSGTDLGVVHNKEKIDLDCVITLHHIKELYELKLAKNKVTIGARVDLTQFQHFIEKKVPEFANFLNIFASLQIRNAGTVVGNVANGSPIGDTIPALFSLEAQVEVIGPKSKRLIPIEQFYLGYRKLNLKKGEWIKSIQFPLPKKGEKVSFYKISNRRDLDIAVVNAGFLYKIKNNKIEKINIAYGGIGPTTKRLYQTEKFLIGKSFNPETIKEALDLIQNEITPISDARSSDLYRRRVSANIFKNFAEMGDEL